MARRSGQPNSDSGSLTNDADDDLKQQQTEDTDSGADLERIGEIIKNARATWFALLGALVFAMVTLASINDAAFFVSDVQTKLPIANISVPVTSFFWAGSMLIAALYVYFHLYLEQLWEALGKVESRTGEKREPVAKHIHPWMVSDTALRLRDWLRNELADDLRSSTKRGMWLLSHIVSLSLVWLFGLAIIVWFWWRSMPAHNPLLTGWLGLVLAVVLWVFGMSIGGSWAHMANKGDASDHSEEQLWWHKFGHQLRNRWRWWAAFSLALILIAGLTTVRTWIDPWEGEQRQEAFTASGCTEELIEAGHSVCIVITKDFLRPARAQLAEVTFTKKPDGWRGKAWEERQFRTEWCKQTWRHGDETEPCKGERTERGITLFSQAKEKVFQEDWAARWTDMRGAFEKPDLRTADLRGANLFDARLEGANLTGARLMGKEEQAWDLKSTRLRGANFSGSPLRRVDLSGTDMAELRDISSSFGDGSVTLMPRPKSDRPSHWCNSELDDTEYFGRLRSWLGDQAQWSMTREEREKYPAIPIATPCPD